MRYYSIGKAASRRLLVAALTLLACTAQADEQVEICYNYGCDKRADVVFTAGDFDALRGWLGAPASAAEERLRIGRAIAILYVAAARTTPIWRDRGGNYPDDPEDQIGAMDCIDHSINVTRFLELLERRGLLYFHSTGARLKRVRGLSDHWAGQLIDRGDAQSYAVDAWYFDHGVPALVLPTARWRSLSDPWKL
jgi:hypothetical protein